MATVYDPLLTPLRSVTLGDQVAERIVDAIAAHRFSSGQRLIETELASILRVSRVPVREAMRSLLSQGIIVPSPRRGLRVADFDADWAGQLYSARVAIERLAANLAAERICVDPTAGQCLEDCLTAITASEGDWLAINRADIAFHTAVFEIAGSQLMTTLWQAMARHVLILFSLETYRDPDLPRVIAEHRTYIDQLWTGTAADIDRTIGEHVAGSAVFPGQLAAG